MDDATRYAIKYASELYKAGKIDETIEILQKLEHPKAQEILQKINKRAPRKPKEAYEGYYKEKSSPIADQIADQVVMNKNGQQKISVGSLVFYVAITLLLFSCHTSYPNDFSLGIAGILWVLMAVTRQVFVIIGRADLTEEKKRLENDLTEKGPSVDASTTGCNIGCSWTAFGIGMTVVIFMIMLFSDTNQVLGILLPVIVGFFLIFFRIMGVFEELDRQRIGRINARRTEWGDEVCDKLIKKIIALGMSEEMVMAGLGKPRYTDQYEISAKKVKVRWVYGKPRVDAQYITFTDGFVSLIKST